MLRNGNEMFVNDRGVSQCSKRVEVSARITKIRSKKARRLKSLARGAF